MYLLSPAKLNLSLQLLGKREDGFHEMATRYQAVAFGDELFLSASSYDSLQVVNACQLETSDNFIWKSTALFRQYTGIFQPVSWRIVKHIPIGAGLAGGSSNAATALFALNQFFEAGLSEDEMRSLAEQVGVDAPFFFSTGSALGLGRGEQILSLKEVVSDKYVLYFSKKGVLTSRAFAAVQPTDCSVRRDFNYTQNDLEKPVFRLREDLKEKKHWLERIWGGLPIYVGLTGSGATLFVRYPEALEEDPIYASRIQRIISSSKGVQTSPIQRDSTAWYSIYSKNAAAAM
ncbi:4-(cytidine 5'-diphospho)-2-C-methyl-D-erythritol kinase [Chlamydia sp.]|uniref:4-(cytidine 5'-diphospho)-2-C-methyl-D-erythritol kinase n=1 Tax=Chlamydia sp. TaxID=35827 RepID=UPI0025C34E8B|nr:4-(cytidine 5'-diphospho)-2-C-methyl-D-erythritol kinase [Chlamydia sp.]MBQ8498551.1 4-(cytidine 5'-diphospho)-2-C-methyl-D-erythritol kinase [Chlamydia sp.]